MSGYASLAAAAPKISRPSRHAILPTDKNPNAAEINGKHTRKTLSPIITAHPMCKMPCDMSLQECLSLLDLSEFSSPTSIDSNSPITRPLTPLLRAALSAQCKARDNSPTVSPSLPMPEHFTRLRSQFSVIASDSFTLGPPAYSSVHTKAAVSADIAVTSPVSITEAHDTNVTSKLAIISATSRSKLHMKMGYSAICQDTNSVSNVVDNDSRDENLSPSMNADTPETIESREQISEAGAPAQEPLALHSNPEVPPNLAIYAPDPAHITVPEAEYISTMSNCRTQEVWIFGYGSLIWKPDVEYTESYFGQVRNSVRRFWQASPDHRGTPEALGRVVTMMVRKSSDAVPSSQLSLGTPVPSSPNNIPDHEWEQGVHGAVFKLSPNSAEVMLDRLCHRERAGYSAIQVDVICEDGVVRTAWSFSADESNEYWAGDEEERDTSAIIATSVGPSGRNIEYFLRLLLCMRKSKVIDSHLERLWVHMLVLQSQEDLELASVGQQSIEKVVQLGLVESESSLHCTNSDPKSRFTRAAVKLASPVLSPAEIEIIKSVNMDILATMDIPSFF